MEYLINAIPTWFLTQANIVVSKEHAIALILAILVWIIVGLWCLLVVRIRDHHVPNVPHCSSWACRPGQVILLVLGGFFSIPRAIFAICAFCNS